MGTILFILLTAKERRERIESVHHLFLAISAIFCGFKIL